MAFDRPVIKDTRYKVIVHTLGKHRYASTKVFTIGEDGKKRYSYKHCGTLDESNRFHPGVNYIYASTGECDKLIFPADWDMSDLLELSSTRRRGRVSYQAEDVDRQYGATWLLDKVAEETGVKDDLLKDRHESRFPARDDHCPEGGKRGRMFIYFVGLILASYVRSVWQKDDVLRKKFSSTEAVFQSISPRLSQQ